MEIACLLEKKNYNLLSEKATYFGPHGWMDDEQGFEVLFESILHVIIHRPHPS